MEPRSAPINEIVTLLDMHGGDVLSRLKEAFPSEKDRLTGGLTLGVDGPSAKLDAEVCLAGLQTAIRVCQRATESLRRRLKLTHGCALAGQILTAIAGASIFGVIAVNAPRTTEYAVGVLALVGALVTIVSEFFSKVGGTGSVADNFAKLNTSAYECALLEASLAGRLRRGHKSEAVWEDIIALVAKGNELSREIVRIASSIGVGKLVVTESDEILATLDLPVEQGKASEREEGGFQSSFRRLAVTGDE